MMATATKKILTCRQEILDYTGLSRHLYTKFIRAGMPVLYVDGHCYAHTDNIDDFFKAITRSTTSKDLPESVLTADDQ